ncbi:hypothetical protein QOT17_008585 [Balamuthia mandrillaris]
MKDRLQRLEGLVANAENILVPTGGQPTRERVGHWKAAAQTREERLAILHPFLSNAAKSTMVHQEFIEFLEILATHPSCRSVRPNAPWTSDAIVSLALKRLRHIREVKQSEELEGIMERISFKQYWKAQLFQVLEPALQQLQEGEIPEVYPVYPPPKVPVVQKASASENALSDDDVKPSPQPPPAQVAKRKRSRKQKASAVLKHKVATPEPLNFAQVTRFPSAGDGNCLVTTLLNCDVLHNNKATKTVEDEDIVQDCRSKLRRFFL